MTNRYTRMHPFGIIKSMGYILNHEEREKEKHSISDIGSWPQWPWLPVKNSNEGLAVGIVHAGDLHPESKRIRVFDVNLWELDKHAEDGKISLDKLPLKKEFTDVDGLLDDGWIGD